MRTICVSVHQVGKDAYEIVCGGTYPDWAIARVNFGPAHAEQMLHRQNVRWEHTKKQRAAKQPGIKARKRVPRTPAPVQQKKARRPCVPAPISLERNERFVPQFRKNAVTWREAINATVAIFETHSTGRQIAREVVASELFASLDRTGGRFAQFRRRRFTLRFDLVDGTWRGDITPLSISCTKDNQHPSYRRMRSYFGSVLTGTSQKKHRGRMALLAEIA